jgi:hypothetical protein
MRVRYLSAILASYVIATLLAGCSQTGREISERKQEIDRQEKAQKQLVQRRTEELKEDVDLQRKESINRLDAEKKKLDLDKELIDQQKKEVDRRADYWKKDLDRQKEVSNKIIERNVKTVKKQIDEYGAAKEKAEQ